MAPESDLPFESGMDVERDPSKDGRTKTLLYAGLAAVLLLGLTMAATRLSPASPEVQRSVLRLGTVERGPLVREVRGPGTLVPEGVHHVTALTAGRVVDVAVEPGDEVTPRTVLLTLANPDVRLEALEAERSLTAARGRLVELRELLKRQELLAVSALARARSEYGKARRRADSDSSLLRKGAISSNRARSSWERARALAAELESAKGRLELLRSNTRERLRIQEEQIGRLDSIHSYRRRRVEAMEVRAGAAGVVQNLALESGQWVQSGEPLARIAEPGVLEAELEISETRARDVRVGQPAMVDLRSDTVAGEVTRIDPAVEEGAVRVEVELEPPLPESARPRLNVDGTIRIERLPDVVHVERPALASPGSSMAVFRLEGDEEAVRTDVRFGAAAVDRIQVLEGLRPGDRIIVSDMSRWRDVERIRLE